MKINPKATYDRIRGRYGSMLKAASAFGVQPKMLYWPIRGVRGGKSHPAPVANVVLERLKAEDLLVYEQDVVNG